MKKILFLFIFSLLALAILGCNKKSSLEEKKEVAKTPEISTEEKKEDCSIFNPPWGEENWEIWAKTHSAEFEKWIVSTMPLMAKVTNEKIKKCSEIRNFFAGFTKIDNLSSFSEMKNLQKLDLRHSFQIKDLTPIKHLENIEYLNIWKTGVTDLSPISNFKKLKYLDAKMTQISDISPLSTIESLESIDLLMTNVSDITTLKTLKKLREIVLCSTKVKDISVLYPIAEQITYLDLCNTEFRDFKELARFKNIKKLKLWGLPIKDASIFSNMENIEELDLWNTKISDISPLFGLKKLKKLVLTNLKIKESQIEKIRKNNPGIEIVTEEM